MPLRILLALACLCVARVAAGQPPDAIEKLVVRLEQALSTQDRAALLALTVKDTDASSVDEFSDSVGADPTRVVVKERDRLPAENGRQEVLLEVFVEKGIEGRLTTWRMMLRPPATKSDPNDWRIGMESVSNVSGLLIALNTTKQYDVRNLALTGTDHARHGYGNGVRCRNPRRSDGDRADGPRTHAPGSARRSRAHAD